MLYHQCQTKPAKKLIPNLGLSTSSSSSHKAPEKRKSGVGPNPQDPPMPHPILRRGKRTNPLIWLAAIVCAVLATATIIAGIVVFSIYMIYQPKLPSLSVPFAHLNKLDYDQMGQLSIEMALTVVAKNDNIKADASFSGIRMVLRFHGIDIAELKADPLEVQRNNSWVLNYVVPSGEVPLDEGGMAEIDAALKQEKVTFDLEGQARTRWRVGVILSVKFWAHLSCELQFSTVNGSSIGLDCSSKSH